MERILIVEDDTALRNGIALALRGERRQVDVCPDLAAARAFLSEMVPDLILLDINLPDGDGRDFLGNVLSGQPAPVLLLTARDAEEDMLQGFRAGCDDYITKPFSSTYLKIRIRSLLQQRKQLQELYLKQ